MSLPKANEVEIRELRQRVTRLEAVVTKLADILQSIEELDVIAVAPIRAELQPDECWSEEQGEA